MLQLSTLLTHLNALRMQYDQDITSGKTFEEVKKLFLEIKEVEKLIDERTTKLKSDGLYKNGF